MLKNTPNDCSPTEINSLFDIAVEISKQHAADLLADPSLAARLDAEFLEQKEIYEANQILRGLVRAQIDPTIPVVKVARALATEGLCLTHNRESGDLYVTYLPDICEHGVDVTDHPVCDDCNEERGAAIQAESVGK